MLDSILCDFEAKKSYEIKERRNAYKIEDRNDHRLLSVNGNILRLGKSEYPLITMVVRAPNINLDWKSEENREFLEELRQRLGLLEKERLVSVHFVDRKVYGSRAWLYLYIKFLKRYNTFEKYSALCKVGLENLYKYVESGFDFSDSYQVSLGFLSKRKFISQIESELDKRVIEKLWSETVQKNQT